MGETASNMEFSIIIPVKNEIANFKKFLHQFEALRGFATYELIIADGASTDGSIEFAHTIADRVEVKTKAERETIGEGRNRGAKVARGDVLVFFDADVEVPDIKHFFSVIRHAFIEQSVVAATTRVAVNPRIEFIRDKIVYRLFDAYIRAVIRSGGAVARGEVQIMRRETFEKVGGYNERLVAGEDFDLYRRLATLGCVIFLEEVYIYNDPRRFRRYGYVRVIFRWIRNDIWIRLTGRAYDKEWERVG